MSRFLVAASLTIPWLGALVGCDTVVTGDNLSGTWGGSHIELRFIGDVARLDYDCANGAMIEPVQPDGRGRFRATGVHVREHGGPIREDEVPDEHPASYIGRVDGREMTLTVTLTDTGEGVGTFSLIQGQTGIVTKCL